MGRPFLPCINVFQVFQVWGCRGSFLALPTFSKFCFGIAFELYFRGCFSNSHFGVVFDFRFRHGFSVPLLVLPPRFTSGVDFKTHIRRVDLMVICSLSVFFNGVIFVGIVSTEWEQRNGRRRFVLYPSSF